jgi:Lytic transglycolase
MQTGIDRRGRKDHSKLGAMTRARPGRRLRRAARAALVAALVLLAHGAVPAAAGTGGASPVGPDGTVPVGQGLLFSSPMRLAGATWYGPGLYGRQTACGATLTPATMGVAHRTLPCGTAIKFAFHGHYLVTRVIDRGPFSPGNAFDLTNGARRALGFEGAGEVQYAIELPPAARRD